MGILHVEQGALVVLGQLLTGTGLEYVLVNAYLDIVSLKTALCDVSSIKKARYYLQVIACCLYHNLVKAYSDSGSSLTPEAWAELKCRSNPMFKYMYSNLILILTCEENEISKLSVIYCSTAETCSVLFCY